MNIKNRTISKQHCKEDTACQPCCSCCKQCNQNSKQRVNNLKDIIDKLKKDKSQLQNTNEKLMQDYLRIKKLHGKCRDIEKIKEQIKEQLERTLLSDKQIQIHILKARLKEMEEGFQEQMRQLSNLERLKDKLQQIEEQNAELKHKLNELSGRLSDSESDSEQREKQNLQLQQKVVSYATALDQKTKLIETLRKSLLDSNKHLSMFQSNIRDLSYQNQKIKAELRNKTNLIGKLQTQSLNHVKSIGMLKNSNQNLQTLIGDMDRQIKLHHDNEIVLEDQLAVAEAWARNKENKLQMLKADVSTLKYIL